MIVNLIVRKTDNGFRAVVHESSHVVHVPLGKELFNRQFHPWKKGELIRVAANYTKSGRVVVKSVSGEEQAQMVQQVKTKGKKAENPLLGYYINSDARLMFTTAKSMSEARPERAVKLMMVGPSGYGKTTLPKLFAEVTGKRFLRMNCATVRDPEEWFGYREAKEGSTHFIRSQFAREIEKGDLVVVLDEFNRLEPWLHNTLFPLLDDDGATVVHDEEFRIGEGVIVVGTINTGYKYTGTFELDEALMNRFDLMLEVGPMPQLEEVNVLVKRTKISRSDATTIVRVSNILRQHEVICSTRTTLAMAMMVRAGMTIRESFEGAVIRRIPTDNSASSQRKKVVDLVNTEIGHYEDRKLTNDVFQVQPETEEDVKVEVGSSSHAIAMTLSLKPNADVMTLAFIKTLRRLPVKKVENDRYFSLIEAKKVCDTVLRGDPVTITFDEISYLDEVIEDLKRYGITGSYRRIQVAS